MQQEKRAVTKSTARSRPAKMQTALPPNVKNLQRKYESTLKFMEECKHPTCQALYKADNEQMQLRAFSQEISKAKTTTGENTKESQPTNQTFRRKMVIDENQRAFHQISFDAIVNAYCFSKEEMLTMQRDYKKGEVRMLKSERIAKN